jgi:signal transduction histidine kinase
MRDWRDNRRPGARARARAQYFQRAGFGGAVLLMMAFMGMGQFVWRVSERAGLPPWSGAFPALLILLSVFVAMAFGAMRAFASPLGSVMDAADRVAGGDYSVRVPETGAPPIRALANAFNAMTARLQGADRVRRDLMADVAHELRTPLTVLQGRLEGLLDGVYPRDETQLAQLLEETQVLSRLVEDLRTVALSDAGALPLQKEPIDIVDLARDAARSFEGRGAPVEVLATGAATLDLDAVRIREVFTNLIANGIRHTPRDGRITIGVAHERDRVVVTVTDTGAGVPPDVVPRLFDRFYKGADSRGSGLGLAIARGIVAAHGGEIGASSAPDEGTTIRFTLPRFAAD